MKDRKKATSFKHSKKINEVLKVLALKGPRSKYELSSLSKKSLTKLSWPLVHQILKELQSGGIVEQYGEKKGSKHKTKVYGLTFYGLLLFFIRIIHGKDKSAERYMGKEKLKAIENYTELHPLLSYWKKLEESLGSKIYEILTMTSMHTLGLGTLWTPSMSHIAFETPPHRLKEEFEKAFTMNFFRCIVLMSVPVKEINLPQIYEYASKIVEKRKREFHQIEQIIRKFK